MLVETKARVGVFAIALGAYLPQFPTLVPEFEGQYAAFKKTLPDTVEVIDGGIVTTKEQSMAAGDKFRTADVDLVILQLLTYATSYNMLPAVIFLVACVLAFASGTSWGTFGILIPIVTAIFPNDSALLYIGISACCAGAVCGDHCSPISDTTIMASAGAQCLHLDHVSTQLPYAVTVAIVSFVGFIVAGFVQNVLITWLVSAALLLGILLFLRARERKKEA